MSGCVGCVWFVRVMSSMFLFVVFMFGVFFVRFWFKIGWYSFRFGEEEEGVLFIVC